MNSGKAILSILAAAAAGTAVGILFAPDSGTNTRKKITKKGNHLLYFREYLCMGFPFYIPLK